MERIENRIHGIGGHAFAFLSFKMIPNVFCFPFLPERKSGLNEETKKSKSNVSNDIYSNTHENKNTYASLRIFLFFTDYGELGGSSTKNFKNDSSGRFEH